MLSFIIKSLIHISNFVTDYFLYLVFSLNIFNEPAFDLSPERLIISQTGCKDKDFFFLCK